MARDRCAPRDHPDLWRTDGWVIGGLCLLTTATGAVDATSFLDLGRTVAANMTGNVLLLAFSLTGTSLGGGSSTRGFAVALVVFVLEVLLVAAALGRTATGSVEETWRRNVVVALLALAMGVQNAIFRRMSVAEANTTVLTTGLGSLAADVVAVAGHPPRTGRRVATVGCIFLGAVLGAELQRHDASWALILALALVASSPRRLVASSAVALGRAGWPAPVG